MTAFTHHGGRIDIAPTLYPRAPRPWIDLSTGINPTGWGGTVASIDWHALPSVSGLAALESAAAATFGVDADRVAALPGTEIGLRLLGGLDLPQPWRVRTPAYRTHAGALPGMAIDTAGLAAAAARGGTILTANPNNPDGVVLAPERLMSVGRAIGARGGWLVVDEAFADVDPATSILPHLAADDRVLVFRSFGKFFGLAGVRLGFAVGPPPMLERMREKLGSWPVSAGAIAIGTAAYRDAAWITATGAALRAQAAALDAVLVRHGLMPTGDCPLFRLIETDDAAGLFDRLARAGILTRAFDDRPRWLRIGLPKDDADRARLDRALADG